MQFCAEKSRALSGPAFFCTELHHPRALTVRPSTIIIAS